MEMKFDLNWSELLENSLKEPGKISNAYQTFHNFSLGNQLAAQFQMESRGIEVTPIKTFKGWQELNRQVKKGSKAIWLLQPVTKKFEKQNGDEAIKTFFMWRNSWFALSQTDGDELSTPMETPLWDKNLALEVLGIRLQSFNHVNGNVQGWAKPNLNELSVSPVAQFPLKTLCHEIAHVLLHKTKDDETNTFSDGEVIEKAIKEVEAEATAMLVMASLGFNDTIEYSKGYLQNWFSGDTIPEKSAEKILATANKILKAGTKKE